MQTEIGTNESISSVNAFTKQTEIDLRSVSDRFKLDRSQCEGPHSFGDFILHRSLSLLSGAEWSWRKL